MKKQLLILAVSLLSQYSSAQVGIIGLGDGQPPQYGGPRPSDSIELRLEQVARQVEILTARQDLIDQELRQLLGQDNCEPLRERGIPCGPNYHPPGGPILPEPRY